MIASREMMITPPGEGVLAGDALEVASEGGGGEGAVGGADLIHSLTGKSPPSDSASMKTG